MHLSFIYSSDDGVGCTCFNVLNAEPAGHLVAFVYLARIWHKANERVGCGLEDNYTIFSIVSSETTSYGLLFWLLDSLLDHGISLTHTSQPLSSSRVKRCFNFAEFTHVYVFGGISLRKKNQFAVTAAEFTGNRPLPRCWRDTVSSHQNKTTHRSNVSRPKGFSICFVFFAKGILNILSELWHGRTCDRESWLVFKLFIPQRAILSGLWFKLSSLSFCGPPSAFLAGVVVSILVPFSLLFAAFLLAETVIPSRKTQYPHKTQKPTPCLLLTRSWAVEWL